MKKRADNRIAGFSPIEVIVGIAVLGLVTVPLCASLVLSVRINAHSRDLMNAQLAAAGMVETLMESGIDEDAFNQADNTMKSPPEGVTVVAEQAKNGAVALPYYLVTVTGESNGQTVTIDTTIREAGMRDVEGGGE